MTDTTLGTSDTAAPATRAPWHLWLVGGLSLLWNAFGGYDYTMTRLRNLDHLGSMGDPNALLAYIDAMPMYAQMGWGLGVWGSVVGSVLLLLRSRWSATAFAVSLVGAVLSFAGQWLGPPPPPEMASGAARFMPLFIIALVALQLWYASRQRARGVLR